MLTSWHVPPEGQQDAPADSGLLVSLHFLLAALRRRWRTWVGLTLVGVMLGVGWVSLVPPRSTGTVTLVLAHDPNVEPAMAMATDISLLRTRTVAETLIDRLDLQMTPEAFQTTVVTTAVTSQVLQIDVAAPDDSSARERAATLAEVFLVFRGRQLKAGSDAIVAGNRERVGRLEEQAAVLTEEFERLSAEGEEGQSEAAGVLTERSRLNDEIARLQQGSEEITLQAEAILQASDVIDPADAVPRSEARRWVLTVGSALVGGLGIGVGYVLVTALTSNRLRRRDEVALALGVPVAASATRRRRSSLEPLVRTVVAAATRSGRRTRLAVVAAPGTKDHVRIVAGAAKTIAASGSSVVLADLSDSGRLDREVARWSTGATRQPSGPLTVIRPLAQQLPSRGNLTMSGPDGPALPEDDPGRASYEAAQVVLVLASVEPTTDLETVDAWADEVVLVVEAGRSSAEWLRSVADLVRAQRLTLSFAMLVRADRTDESLGLISRGGEGGGAPAPAAGPARDGADGEPARRSAR